MESSCFYCSCFSAAHVQWKPVRDFRAPRCLLFDLDPKRWFCHHRSSFSILQFSATVLWTWIIEPVRTWRTSQADCGEDDGSGSILSCTEPRDRSVRGFCYSLINIQKRHSDGSGSVQVSLRNQTADWWPEQKFCRTDCWYWWEPFLISWTEAVAVSITAAPVSLIWKSNNKSPSTGAGVGGGSLSLMRT